MRPFTDFFLIISITNPLRPDLAWTPKALSVELDWLVDFEAVWDVTRSLTSRSVHL